MLCPAVSFKFRTQHFGDYLQDRTDEQQLDSSKKGCKVRQCLGHVAQGFCLYSLIAYITLSCSNASDCRWCNTTV